MAHKMLGSRCLLFLGSLLLLHSVPLQARYYGAAYQDGGPQEAYELADNEPIPISALEGLAQAVAPVAAESSEIADPANDFAINKMLLVSTHAQEDQEWTKLSTGSLSKLGQVAGVAASHDFLYAFHRGSVTWNDRSFNDETNVYNNQNNPIKEKVVVALDLTTGEEMFAFGNNSFYMPHGISVDPQGNIWLTDVALHQAFRYKKGAFQQADLILGERFVPGSDGEHFCKPTDVAVSSSGVVYIADGYCNSRIAIFSAAGKYLAEIGHNDKMLIPHSLTLLEVEDLICAADRENGRILCYNAGLASYKQAGQLLFEVSHLQIEKLYAIDHIGDVILALNGGPNSRGVSVDLATEQVVDGWSPVNETFHEAHDLTVSRDGRSFYVAQLSSPKKILKFDMIETQPLFMN